jgi:hypothetical protein
MEQALMLLLAAEVKPVLVLGWPSQQLLHLMLCMPDGEWTC